MVVVVVVVVVVRLIGKFATHLCLNIPPPQLNCVATLPCEISVVQRTCVLPLLILCLFLLLAVRSHKYFMNSWGYRRILISCDWIRYLVPLLLERWGNVPKFGKKNMTVPSFGALS